MHAGYLALRNCKRECIFVRVHAFAMCGKSQIQLYNLQTRCTHTEYQPNMTPPRPTIKPKSICERATLRRDLRRTRRRDFRSTVPAKTPRDLVPSVGTEHWREEHGLSFPHPLAEQKRISP